MVEPAENAPSFSADGIDKSRLALSLLEVPTFIHRINLIHLLLLLSICILDQSL